MGFTNFPHGITSFGVPIFGSGQRDISGSTYFVDNNCGSDSNDGSSWERCFKTLAKAVAVSNVDIARGSDRWARRNTIYYCADTETADLVAFPNKCDVIGVGSYDSNKKPGITGNHVPVNSGNWGSRFINIWFKAPADASPIVTLASTTGGCEFHGCTFDATATTTIGIQATASPFLKIYGCRFQGAYATAAISIAKGEAGSTEIVGNDIMQSAAVGILINSQTTCSWPSTIKDNLIQAATITIDDNSDLFYITGNELISAAAGATVGTMADEMQCDLNVFRASNNRLACSNVCGVAVPPVDTTT